MNRPMAEMQAKVDGLLGKANATDLKYMIYSAHDDNVVNMISWLHPRGLEMDNAVYASNVVFELKYFTECLDTDGDNDESCFRVGVRLNG